MKLRADQTLKITTTYFYKTYLKKKNKYTDHSTFYVNNNVRQLK